MRRFAVPLATLMVLALAAGTAKAGGLSYPVAAQLAAQTVAHPYNDCYGGPGVAYYPPYWYGPGIVARPVYPPPWHPRIVHPPVHHHHGHDGHHGGFHYYGR